MPSWSPQRVLSRAAVFVTPHFVAQGEIIAALGAETESTPVGTWITDRIRAAAPASPACGAIRNVADVSGFVIEAAGAHLGLPQSTRISSEEDVTRAMHQHAGLPSPRVSPAAKSGVAEACQRAGLQARVTRRLIVSRQPATISSGVGVAEQ